ncbi:1-deoxy-D-xylulose-5-phosphate synthase [Nocardia sp. NPDC049149]|uniref:1-deoxy-D-xylulose-5-phosphate synthase n=1 Tax=Nocardia sp. NPDC049149 TaxID=3364315 RepID=UPI00371809C7
MNAPLPTTQATPAVAAVRLSAIANPEHLRAVPLALLPALAAQIRAMIIDTVTVVSGHLGPNLGVVELTIALHRVFESPRDTLLFDTGHQAYVHKILTGRQRAFAETLRQPGGLSGYPLREESVHDVIENSHASTALSYADGIAKARAIIGDGDRAVVAVVGDGALTGGMAYEALNNIGAAKDRPVIMVLNDNGHSYSPTVGAVAAHLGELPSRSDAPNLFEHLGFAYLGPVDGHDVGALEPVLRQARGLGCPVVVHVRTSKGKGYAPACAHPEKLHTAGPTAQPGVRPTPTWTAVFAAELAEIGARRSDVVAVTAAMPGPTGLTTFADRFPERCFDVGIAEQHAVTSAAGLATAGMHPVVAIYATFLNRAYDQLLMDVALHRLPVTFVLDRAGITGPDGPSHHGMWDLSLLGTVPGLRVAAPRDAERLRELLSEAVDYHDGPTALRFPKAAIGHAVPAVERIAALDILLRAPAAEVLLVAVGPTATECVAAWQLLADRGIAATVADPRWVLPIADELIALATAHRVIVTVEDNIGAGGVGAALTHALTAAGSRVPVHPVALPRRFLAHGHRRDILVESGLCATGIVDTVVRARQLPTPIERGNQ